MEKYEKQQGISFLIIYYSQKETLYYMRFGELLKFWKRAQSGGRKSIRFEELSPEYFMALKIIVLFHIWIIFKKIWMTGIDRRNESSYNYRII